MQASLAEADGAEFIVNSVVRQAEAEVLDRLVAVVVGDGLAEERQDVRVLAGEEVVDVGRVDAVLPGLDGGHGRPVDDLRPLAVTRNIVEVARVPVQCSPQVFVTRNKRSKLFDPPP